MVLTVPLTGCLWARPELGKLKPVFFFYRIRITIIGLYRINEKKIKILHHNDWHLVSTQ